ncbi:EamA family transporter [Ramlibacter sp. H39-3-26]|uniref:DMT family transporter n=1 Tax=Curvibacter soli TaxID=3031331 RepID=UPI0023DAB981|nr:EamA family transporter [Ramlibacter sp. H39-3-26]MDF1486086.1 EamA family transporter [Ramlibacter sp. H39-3-26]
MTTTQRAFTASAARGIALVVLASVLWGTSGTAQSLGAAGLSPFWVGAAQLAVSSVFLGGVLLPSLGPGRTRGSGFTLCPRRAGLRWPWFAWAAAGMGGYSVFFYEGVKLAGVGVGTAVAIGSGPIWAGLLQAAVLRTPLPALWWGGTLVSVAGGAAMVAGRGAGAAVSWPGLAMCLLAGLSYSGAALLSKRLVGRMPPKVVNFYVFTGAALLAVPIAWLQGGAPRWTWPAVLVVVYLGVVVSGIAHLLFSIGLRHVSGPTGVALSLIEPVAAFVLAMAVVGERPEWVAFAGLAGVLAGLAIVVRAEMRTQARVGAAVQVPPT